MKEQKYGRAAHNGTEHRRLGVEAGGGQGKGKKRDPAHAAPPPAPWEDGKPAITAAEAIAHNRAMDEEASELVAVAKVTATLALPNLALRATAAASARQDAADKRADAIEDNGRGWHDRAAGDTIVAGHYERDAVRLEVVPGKMVRGTGGEVTITDPHPPPSDSASHCFLDTLEMPTTTAAAASRARMTQALAFGHETLAQATDAAETLGARNSLEKMGAHQFAAAHGMAMKLLHEGAELLRKRDFGHQRSGSQFDASEFYTVEGCRLLNMATRLMAASQGWLSTLARVRQGGRQVVTVQHVQVNDGGQAVVAGSVGGTGGGGALPGEGDGRGN